MNHELNYELDYALDNRPARIAELEAENARLRASLEDRVTKLSAVREDNARLREELKATLVDFTLWLEIAGIVDEDPNRTEQDWEDQVDSFLLERCTGVAQEKGDGLEPTPPMLVFRDCG